MRDDARSIVADLSRAYGKKIELLRTLLASETDKLYYEKSGNLDRVIEIIRDDARVIEEVDLVNYDIAESEGALSALIGVAPGGLYGVLAGSVEARDLLSLRSESRNAVDRLVRERTALIARLEAASRGVHTSIDELSRIGRLKRDENGDLPPLG